MKAVIQVPLVNIDSVALVIENRNWTLKSIMPIMRTMPVLAVDSSDATKINVYVNIDVLIQGAKYSTSGNGSTDGTNATKFTVLDNNVFEIYSNFQTQDIAKFVRGQSYLIPTGAYGPLNMIPDIKSVPVAGFNTKIGTAGAPNVLDVLYAPIMNSDKYLYESFDDRGLMNATSISDVITFRKNGKLAEELNGQKQVVKAQEAVNYAAATGAVQTASAIAQSFNLDAYLASQPGTKGGMK